MNRFPFFCALCLLISLLCAGGKPPAARSSLSDAAALKSQESAPQSEYYTTAEKTVAYTILVCIVAVVVLFILIYRMKVRSEARIVLQQMPMLIDMAESRLTHPAVMHHKEDVLRLRRRYEQLEAETRIPDWDVHLESVHDVRRRLLSIMESVPGEIAYHEEAERELPGLFVKIEEALGRARARLEQETRKAAESLDADKKSLQEQKLAVETAQNPQQVDWVRIYNEAKLVLDAAEKNAKGIRVVTLAYPR